PNLTVLTRAEVRKIALSGKRATSVEFTWNGKLHKIAAGKEIVLSAGALNSPKLLMLSGIGDTAQLRRAGVRPLHHLPGVGQNFMDHI
ncbi:GMC family oxidoreductase N-terminal domain-containing protein, partial [Listeria monocytogenes]|uniref:GMC family oxidoreductase N-terminal domain-containing protein n=1 Tax=Listeria monocytogenes TaxID=1639 RepID=UPI001A8D50A2